MSNFWQLFYEKAALMNFTGKHLCRNFFPSKVSHLHAKERLIHRCFPVSFTKYFRKLSLQNTSGWLLMLNILFCLLRRPQPQKMFPSTLVILNTFETNTLNCLQAALCGGPRQTVSLDKVDLLLIEQVIGLKCCWKSKAVA